MLLLVNVDDVSGEVIPHLIDGLMARGAESVHVVQAITKKGRLEFLFFVDAPAEQVEALGGFLAGEIGTLGVRVFDPHHIRFEYRVRQVRLTAQTSGDPVQVLVGVKEILGGEGQVVSIKAEYEDLRAAVARLEQVGLKVSFGALKRLVEQAALRQENGLAGELGAVPGIQMACSFDEGEEEAATG
jgi:uncharacterized protein (DUF111 family)